MSHVRHDQIDPLHEPFAGAMTGWVEAITHYSHVVRVLVGGGLTTWIDALPRAPGALLPPLHPAAIGYHRWYPHTRHALVEALVRQRVHRIKSELGEDARIEGRVYVLRAEDVALLALAEVE